MRIRIVVPAYNEEKRLLRTVVVMCEYLKGKVDADILLVNDGSTDGTLGQMQAISGHFSNVHYISYSQNKGKGYAVRAGMLMGNGYDYILFSDADGSSHLRYIIPKLRDNCHSVIITNREMQGSKVSDLSFSRWIASRVYWLLRLVLLQEPIRDTNNGLKAFRGDVAQAIFSRSRIDGFSFDVESLFIARNLGFSVREVPVVWLNTPDSRVKLFKHSVGMLLDLARIRMNAVRGLYK